MILDVLVEADDELEAGIPLPLIHHTLGGTLGLTKQLQTQLYSVILPSRSVTLSELVDSDGHQKHASTVEP